MEAKWEPRAAFFCEWRTLDFGDPYNEKTLFLRFKWVPDRYKNVPKAMLRNGRSKNAPKIVFRVRRGRLGPVLLPKWSQ